MDRYVARLCDELIARAPSLDGRCVDTVYFGGGTPTLLSPAHFSRLLDTVRAHYDVLPDAEITTECNPATTDESALRALRRMGVNRLSVGAQSAIGGELAALGRIHIFADTVETVRAARAAGFDNLSLDVMFGIPSQTRQSFGQTLEAIISLSPDHVSAYSLILEEGTPFWRMRDTLDLPDEDTVCDMMADAIARLGEAGYARYEISNFARAGRQSRHNVHYWRLDDYVGVGVAAHSLVDGLRLQNRPDLDAYLDGEDVSEQEERLTDVSAADEYVMLALRLTEGVDKAELFGRFGVHFDERYAAAAAHFVRMGLMTDTPDRIAFTEAGFAVSNAVLAELLFHDE